MTGTRVGAITHAHINAFLHFLKISGRWMTKERKSLSIKMSVFSCIGWLFLLFYFILFLVSDRLRCITAHVIRLPLCSFKSGLEEEELQKHSKAWEAAGDETLHVCETSSCSLPRSSLEGRSAPLQVLFFTVHDRFSQQCDPSSAGSCLSSFQLPVIQAWLSSEGMSEMFKQQP